jgi:hypothetical protein
MPRRDTDDEPEEWKTALPIRSPIPIFLLLMACQIAVGVLLVGIELSGVSPSKPTSTYYQRR